MSNEQKFTLDDILNGDDGKLIKLSLLEDDLENILHFFGGTPPEVMDVMLPKRQDQYSFMRGICLIDIAIHKQGSFDCVPGMGHCGLLNTLNAFTQKFKNEIAKDTHYKLADFTWE